MTRQFDKQRIRELRHYISRRKAIYNFLQKTLLRIKAFDQLFVIIMAVLIGIVSGYIAVGFRMMIRFFQNHLWGSGYFVELVRTTPFYLKLAIPAIGGTIVAVFVHQFAREAKGHGVPEVMNAVATKNGFIRMRVVLVKALASALSIGSGASVGREGPIVQIGSAFGSSLGQLLQVSVKRMNTFIGCGAAAGIAATFNAPIAGAIFASEVILGDFSISSISPIMVSSVFGVVISHSVYGDYPAFVPPIYVLQSPIELIFYALLGVAAGLVGWIFVRGLYFTEDLFDNWKLSIGVKAFIGGSILGGLAIFFPEVLGVGYESMDLVLVGKFSAILALFLLVGKVLATSISLGSGGSGGIFAPSLFMGAMLGASIGSLFHSLIPTLTASPGAYALVGMAAVVSATTHAPITAILIIFEMTTEYSVILPLMISSIISTVITSRLLEGNIYTIKLLRRGIKIHGGKDVNVLDQLSVDKIKKKFIEIVDESLPVTELLAKMSVSNHSSFYVCDQEKRLVGIVTQGSIRRFLNRFEQIPPNTTVRDISNKHFSKITKDTPIHEALRMMIELDRIALPVVDTEGKITGQVTRGDIIREYQDLLLQTQSADYIASTMKYIHRHFHEKSEVIPGFFLARIDVPSKFVNYSVSALNIRKKYNVEILLIRKNTSDGFKNTIPSPKTIMEPGDQILIFGEKEHVDNVCQLL